MGLTKICIQLDTNPRIDLNPYPIKTWLATINKYSLYITWLYLYAVHQDYSVGICAIR